jgi:glutamate-1-semialdehyde 2,1-aminomutase
MTDRSARLWAEANKVLAGGVNSPVRAFKAVGGHPFFARSGRGPRITDADGNRYIDYVLSWGPLIDGHAHPAVVEAVTRALRDGPSFGVPTEGETRLAEHHRLVPSIEWSGSVAAPAALGASGCARRKRRDVIVKVDGGYHGEWTACSSRQAAAPTFRTHRRVRGCPAASTLSVPSAIDAARSVRSARQRIACMILDRYWATWVVLPGPAPASCAAATLRCHIVFERVMSGFRRAGRAQSITA